MNQRVRSFLFENTYKEELVFRGNYNKEKDQVYQRLDGNKKEIYLFEDKYFMSPKDKVGILRQDRFQKVLPHCHNYIEMTYVWRGKCCQTIGEDTYVLYAGDISLLDTLTVHAIEAAGEEDIIVNILMRKSFFDVHIMERLASQGGLVRFFLTALDEQRRKQQYLMFNNNDDTIVRQRIETLILEYVQGNIGYRQIMENELLSLLIELLRKHPLMNDTHEEKLLEVSKIIRECQGKCSLEEVAKDLGFHPKYLTTALKRTTGKSFIELVQDYRLEKARELLQYTRMPIQEVMEHSGYNNRTFFYQLFKKKTHMTPRQYRQEKRKEI